MIQFFTQNKVAANLLMLILMAGGLWSLSQLNAQFLPTFELNYVTVEVAWPRANAKDVETAILIPLTRELRDIENIKKMRSIAREGMARLVLEFHENTDMTLTTDKIKTRVQRAKPFPSDVEEPVITRLEQFDPIATVLIHGEVSFEKLKQIAYSYETELLQRGIDKIDLIGIPDEEILIEVPTQNLLQMNSTIAELAHQIASANPEKPIGNWGSSEIKKQIRTPRQVSTIEGFQSLLIRSNPMGENIKLNDIAKLSKVVKENQTALYYHDKPAIQLKLQRSEFGDTLKSAEILKTWYDEKRNLPDANIEVIVYEEQWQLVQQRLSLLLNNGFTGLCFILLVLFLFLQPKTAFWIAAGIPISILTTLLILHLSGGSINMISLFALIMSLGIIVDDTIVVGENTLMQYHQGKNALEASMSAASKMAKPIIASSLTTIAAFLPLVVIGGIIGQIIIVIPWVIICVILASLLECFLILPYHLKESLKVPFLTQPNSFRARFEEKFLTTQEVFIQKLILPAVLHPSLALTTAVCLFILSLSLILTGRVLFTFFPTPDGQQIRLNVKFIAGTEESRVYEYLKEAEKSLENVNLKLFETEGKSIVKVHTITTGRAAESRGNRTQKVGPSYGHLAVELLDSDERKITNHEFMNAWRHELPYANDIETLEVTSLKGGPPGQDIELKLSNLPADELKSVAETIDSALNQLPGVSNVMDDLPYGKPNIELYSQWPTKVVNLSIDEISTQLRNGLSGIRIQQLQFGREEVDVRLSLPQSEQSELELLDYFPIKTPMNKMLPLPNLVSSKVSVGFDEIRYDMSSASVIVTAEVDPSQTNTNQVLEHIQKQVIPELVLKYPHLKVSFEGRAKEQSETLRDMKLGALMAFLFIYFILVMIFTSYYWPMVMLCLLPLSITGAIFGHWIMGYDLTILSLFGIFGLCGIVANDGIILVTCYLEKKDQFDSTQESMISAIHERFRAVFLTSITTIVGLTPLLFEHSLQAQFLIPMAISLTFGLTWGFFLILLVLPGFLMAFERLALQASQYRRESLSKSRILRRLCLLSPFK